MICNPSGTCKHNSLNNKPWDTLILQQLKNKQYKQLIIKSIDVMK